MFRRHSLLALPTALGLGLVACKESETSSLPPNPGQAPKLPAAPAKPRTAEQGLDGFFTPQPGETWTYVVHRDLPPDSLLNDDDQLRSSDLPGGGYRFTNERQRVCLGSEDVDGSPNPLTVFELSENGAVSGREFLDIGPEGLIARGWQQSSISNLPARLLNPGVLLATPGMAGGQSWESSASSPDQPIQFRVIERSHLTVPAGDYEAVRIQMNTGNDSRGVRRTLWFAENVGIVKEETIHYDEHRITVRETTTLTAWSLPAEEAVEAPAPPTEEISPPLEILPPPPDEETDPEDVPESVPGEDSPIVTEEEDVPAEEESPPAGESDEGTADEVPEDAGNN